jgi:hypothetical protein
MKYWIGTQRRCENMICLGTREATTLSVDYKLTRIRELGASAEAAAPNASYLCALANLLPEFLLQHSLSTTCQSKWLLSHTRLTSLKHC